MDKLFLPGLMKLAMLKKSGFFGRMLAMRSEFGYWVFEGDLQPIQRPSWNYRAEDGGGIVLDMMCHWRYVLDHVFGKVESVSCLAVTHIPERWDEAGKPYKATADDAAFATFMLEGGVVATINFSWVTRVYRDDLVVFQVDGTHGSATAGLHSCKVQPRVATAASGVEPGRKGDPRTSAATGRTCRKPRPISTVSAPSGRCSSATWQRMQPFPYTLREGAKGLELVEAAERSTRERRWIDLDGAGR